MCVVLTVRGFTSAVMGGASLRDLLDYLLIVSLYFSALTISTWILRCLSYSVCPPLTPPATVR